jgi:hypothetical protein
MTLFDIGQQLSIYFGYFILLTGLVGNSMNIFIMSSVRTYRTTPCTFYFLIASIFNIIYIVITLLIRIVTTGSGIDLILTSIIWCKIRALIVVSLSPVSFICSCLASVDQFLITSRSVHLRRLSNIKWAHGITIVVIIVWCLHAIPVFLYYNIPPITHACASINSTYTTYISIYIIIVLCAVPVIVMSVFGYLAYCNIRLTRALIEQHFDRQIARMTLIQIVVLVISMIPGGIYNIYHLVTANVPKDLNRQNIENFVNTIIVLISYFYYAVCIILYSVH